jgi:CRISPR-associated protein Cmr1
LPDPPEWVEPVGRHVETYTIDVITPMFGGGYEPGVVDPECVIRPAAIRGHLRFWWRATAGARYSSPKELFGAEERLWGSATRPGQVALAVTILKAGSPQPCSSVASPKVRPNKGPEHGCFIWPFQEQKETPERAAQKGVSFCLTVTCAPGLTEQDRRDVAETVRVWVWFGGVGSRTRRGCGAIDCEPLRIGKAAAPAWEASSEVRHTVLAGARYLLGEPERSVEEAWRRLGRFWSQFRKGHWDEEGYQPMKGGAWSDYRGQLVRANPSDGELRLAKPFLGMPINYQKFSNAPFDKEIVPGDSGRMASPIVLRPVIVADDRIRPMVLILRSPKPTTVRLGASGPKQPLRVPADDPVLKQLHAKDPVEAVVTAARRTFVRDCDEYVLGGAS